jgi:predicted N-acetyltransferase YhbS
MEFKSIGRDHSTEVTDLFRSCFTSSEGAAEGAAVAALAEALAGAIDDGDILCFAAVDNEALVGAIFFSKLAFESPAQVYMLSPVGVRTARQGQGIGTKLIAFGLKAIRARGAQVAVTYGDPNFYRKLGFLPLPEDRLRAPMELSMPLGWLGQSLTASPIPTLGDRPKCVGAFNDPKYW